MADLIARGIGRENYWRRMLPAGSVTLGRSLVKSDWDVSWDRFISRLCATLTWRDDKLLVVRDSNAQSEIFVQGEARDEFSVAIGEEFVIGETTFTVEESNTASEELPDQSEILEMVYSRQELQQVKYDGGDERIEVLAALPEMIRYSPSDEELGARVVEVLLRGLPRADAVGIVRAVPLGAGGDFTVEVPFLRCRDERPGGFRPSRRLILDVLNKRRQSTIYVWASGDSNVAFTGTLDMSWAICVPMPDEPEPGWVLYVAGRRLPVASTAKGGDQNPMKGDAKFVELVADIFGSIRQVCHLQKRQASLERLLSRPVMAALANKNIDEVLKPRETEVTVLFCDIRGSCRIADESRDDLSGLWERVSEALSVMTSSILDLDGIIGDFQGDAAMGFWGWPLDTSDRIERAARAALMIFRRFKRAALQPRSPLSGFQCGIGISTGPAFAGRLGTHDQYKVGVFGPIVNLASRLESLTKLFQVAILLDERSAQHLSNGQNSHWALCRRLARVLPYGMKTPLTVSELLPSFEPGAASERHYRDYEAALESFLEGDWTTSRKLLRRVPPDRSSTLIIEFMERHLEPPTNWDGVIVLETK